METRNIGTSGASASANATALQNAMKLALTQETEIVLGADASFEAVSFEKNITNFPLTIRVADPQNPAIMEGIRFCNTQKDGFFNKIGNVPGATSLQDITIDGIHFLPRRLTVVERLEDPDHPYTIQDAPEGLAWRIDPSFEGFQTGSEAYSAKTAYMIAFIGFGGTQNITIQNCYFRGYGRVGDIRDPNGLKIRHNTVERWNEDCWFIGGGTNITIEYNQGIQCGPLSYRDAFYGWGYGWGEGQPPRNEPVSNLGAPPHCDWCQVYGKTTNFIYQFNEVYDDSGRAHPLLFNLQGDGNPTSEYHVGARIINNFARSSHPTQWWIDEANAPVIERNKGLRVGSENVSLQIDVRCTGATTIRNNRAQKVNDGNPQNTPGSWVVSGNVETNDPLNLPPGWIEFRRGHADLAEGAKFAGQYGGGGAVAPPTQPAALAAGEVAFEALVQDPAYLDARRTFTIRVPASSPAKDAFELRWSSDEDTTVRIMTQLADAGADEIWRASSNGTVHLRSPNETFTNVKLYYREVSGGSISLPSTYTFTETVPDEGNPDPIVTDVIFVDQTQRVTMVEGDAWRLATKEDGIIWQQPG